MNKFIKSQINIDELLFEHIKGLRSGLLEDELKSHCEAKQAILKLVEEEVKSKIGWKNQMKQVLREEENTKLRSQLKQESDENCRMAVENDDFSMENTKLKGEIAEKDEALEKVEKKLKLIVLDELKARLCEIAIDE